MGLKLPKPSDPLAGCAWLPRILAKARMSQSGALPAEYAERFCHPGGVDGHFLTHFGLTREDILQMAGQEDAAAVDWFTARASEASIRAWNESAMNFGRPGYPMGDRFPVAMNTVYKHLANRGYRTVFEVLAADDLEA